MIKRIKCLWRHRWLTVSAKRDEGSVVYTDQCATCDKTRTEMVHDHAA